MSYKYKIIFLFFLIIPFYLHHFAAHADVLQDFDSAGQLYQNKSYKEAKDLYLRILKTNPTSQEVLHNLALTEFALGEKSLAIASFRTLSALNPRSLVAPNAIQYIQSTLENKDFQKETSFFEELNEKILIWLTLPEWLVIQLICFAIGGYVLVKHFALRKQMKRLEEPIPNFELKHYSIGFGLFLIVFLLALKINYAQETKATLVYNGKLAIKSGPSSQASDLNELYDGFEVTIDSQHKDWSQITYQDNITGWVETKYLSIHQTPFF